MRMGNTNWDGIIPALLQGKYDIIIVDMSIMKKGKKRLTSPQVI